VPRKHAAHPPNGVRGNHVPTPPYRVRKDRLANGLRLSTVEAPYLHSAVVALYVRAGSRYETPATNGLSHFVEHMLFRGSKGFPNSYALNLAIEERGGTLYAETGRDYSLFQIGLSPREVPDALAILGDLYTAAERGKYAGLMSSVFGLASVIGPLIGGAITDNFDWRWVFYVNIPLGLLALVVLWLVLPASPVDAPGRSLDSAGAAALAAAIAPLLLAFSWAGNDYGWTDRQVITPFLISAAMFVLFIVLERRAADPIVPLSLFRN
jgi:hypothetical protein